MNHMQYRFSIKIADWRDESLHVQSRCEGYEYAPQQRVEGVRRRPVDAHKHRTQKLRAVRNRGVYTGEDHSEDDQERAG
jgi:hypothetical protein